MCFTVQLSRFLSCDSHIRLSHLFWLVKNFFHFLENLFSQATSQADIPVCAFDDCCVNQYHAACGVIIDFQEFLKFLESTALADSYVRIPHLSKSVNAFFTLFTIFCITKEISFYPLLLK